MDFSSLILEIIGLNPDLAEGSKTTLKRYRSSKPDEYFDELFRLAKGKIMLFSSFQKVETWKSVNSASKLSTQTSQALRNLSNLAKRQKISSRVRFLMFWRRKLRKRTGNCCAN